MKIDIPQSFYPKIEEVKTKFHWSSLTSAVNFLIQLGIDSYDKLFNSCYSYTYPSFYQGPGVEWQTGTTIQPCYVPSTTTVEKI